MSAKGTRNETAGRAAWKFVGLSALAGILSLALLAPTALFGSVAASAGFTIFENLPDYIKPVNASQSSTLYGTKNGEPVEIAKFYHENRISVDYNDISPYVRDAVVATEDPRFFQHGGVDVVSLIRAAATNAAMGGGGPGASTITMQYVKNSLVEAANLSGNKEAIEAATAVTIDRKLREMRLAIALEGVATKKEILAGYLNLSFFGNNLNGIESAANYYFGVKAKDLNIAQSALLAGMLKSPNDYKPDEEENLDRALGRRNYVIDNMASEGYITKAEAAAAKAAPIITKITNAPSGCEANQTAAFFCDYVVWTIRNSPEFGSTTEDREMLLRRGGLEIYSTVDLEVQTKAHEAIMTWAPAKDPSQVGSSLVSVQAGTGRILAMTQNRIFNQTDNPPIGETSVNYSTDRAYGGSSGFQTGSTYKIFTLSQWLQNGYKLNDHVDGRIKEWNAAEFSARCGALVGTWKPGNDSPAAEDLTAVQATAKSVNTAFASMASKLDLCDIRDTAMRFGIHRADGNELQYVPASIIGTNELAPLTMAAAMAAIANKGTYCTPIAIDKIIRRTTKEELRPPQSICSQAVTPEVAAGMTYAMQRVISGGTGGASATGDNTPLAGKTGTTDSRVHTWMTGFSSAVGTAVWVGNVVGTQSLGGIRLNNKAANTVRHDIWRTTMQTVNKLYPGTAFDAPPAEMMGPTMLSVPETAGMAPDQASEVLKTAQFNTKFAVGKVTSGQPAGSVAYTQPAAGQAIPLGTQVKIFISRGGAAATAAVPATSGMTVAAAKETLLKAGFAAVSEPQASQTQYFQNHPDIPAGNVIGTQPAAGTQATKTGAILLIISKGP